MKDKYLTKYMEYVKKLPEEVKDALICYTSNEIYKDLNKKLRRGDLLNEFELHIVKNIDEAFRFAPELTEAITVYRGVKGHYNPEAISYVSTSLKPQMAKYFAGQQCCLLKIIISPGSKILPLRDISIYSNENEVLIDRIGTFAVTFIEKQKNKTDVYNVIYMPPVTVVVDNISLLENPEKIVATELEVNRILDVISKDTIDEFGLENAVQMVATNLVDIAPTSITRVLDKLMTIGF